MTSLFQGAKHAKAYALYRPHFPAAVFEDIVTFCKSVGNKFRLAVDIGCGSGQSTLPLSPHFTQVVGIDPSASQISQTKTDAANVQFKVGKSEELFHCSNYSVDLLCAFQALHWFDTDQFYPEAARVLAPGGVLVACGYGNVSLDNPKASDIISQVNGIDKSCQCVYFIMYHI